MKCYISETELYPVISLGTPADMDWETEDFIHEVPEPMVRRYQKAYKEFMAAGEELRVIMDAYNKARSEEGK